MKWFKLLLLVTLPITSLAQGTFLFTWHGESNFFQASFELTAADMVPGGRFTSQLFQSSMSVDSLSGEHYQGGNSSSFGAGGFYADAPGFFMVFQLNDFDKGLEIHVSDALIHEEYMSGPELNFEPGYWTYSAIPEPSSATLSSFGLLMLLGRKVKV